MVLLNLVAKADFWFSAIQNQNKGISNEQSSEQLQPFK